jgi:hypothetical protein
MSAEDFRDFAFANPARFFTDMNRGSSPGLASRAR